MTYLLLTNSTIDNAFILRFYSLVRGLQLSLVNPIHHITLHHQKGANQQFKILQSRLRELEILHQSKRQSRPGASEILNQREVNLQIKRLSRLGALEVLNRKVANQNLLCQLRALEVLNQKEVNQQFNRLCRLGAMVIYS